EKLYAEIHELVSGAKKGRERDDERILIHTTGLVSQDVALAHFLYRRALDKGLGLWLPRSLPSPPAWPPGQRHWPLLPRPVASRDKRPPGCGRGARLYTGRSSESLGRSHALSASIPRRAAGAASSFGSRGPAGAA